MSSVRQILNRCTVVTVFYLQKSNCTSFISLRAILAFFIVAMTSPAAIASSNQKTFLVNQSTATQKRGQVAGSFHIQWHAPKFVKLVDKTHGRFLIEGKAEPGAKIQIEPHGDWIDSQDKAGDLTIEDMAPSQNEITTQTDGRFKFFVTLPFKFVDIPFTATKPPASNTADNRATASAQAQVKRYVLAMGVSKPAPLQRPLQKAQQKPSHWNVGIAARSVTYSQTNISNLNETMLAFDVSYEHALSKVWSFKARSFIDLAGDAPLSTNQNQGSARFWNANSDVIYQLPINSHQWTFGLAGGFFYTSMYSSGINFGFRNLWGPELYPIVTRLINDKNRLDFYFKYAPVISQSPVNLSNHELDVGVEWTKFFADKKTDKMQTTKADFKGVTYKLEILQDVLNRDGASAQSTAVNLGVSLWVP